MQARFQWSLLWWALVLLPVGVVIAIAVVGFPLWMIALPISAGMFFINGSWTYGAVSLIAMTVVISVRHWVARRVAGGYSIR